MGIGTPEIYRRFAEVEARESSPTYYKWARAVAEDPAVVGLIDTLPRAKRQPNLVFAAARSLGAPMGTYSPLRDWLLTNWDAVAPVALARATQTNEANRCAVLLPILSALPGPLALIEAGASAGLCLYPDRYSYRYETAAGPRFLQPADGPSAVELTCSLGAADAPSRLPEVVWRAGADLNPIDLHDAEQEFPSLSWLDTDPVSALSGLVRTIGEALEDMSATGEAPPVPLADAPTAS